MFPDLFTLSSQFLVSAQQLNGRNSLMEVFRNSSGADRVDVGRGSGSVSVLPVPRPAPTGRPTIGPAVPRRLKAKTSKVCPPPPGVPAPSGCRERFERFDDILCYDDDDCPNGYDNKKYGCVNDKCSYEICQCRVSASYIPIYAR